MQEKLVNPAAHVDPDGKLLRSFPQAPQSLGQAFGLTTGFTSRRRLFFSEGSDQKGGPWEEFAFNL